MLTKQEYAAVVARYERTAATHAWDVDRAQRRLDQFSRDGRGRASESRVRSEVDIAASQMAGRTPTLAGDLRGMKVTIARNLLGSSTTAAEAGAAFAVLEGLQRERTGLI